MINEADYTIVATFGAEYRGIVQYYLLAGDVYRLHRLRWVMETSMLKTLAGKHRSSVSKMAARHKAKIATPHGPRTCFEASVERDGRKPLVARFGGIPLKRQKNGGPHRPRAHRARLPAQGADHPAPRGQVRALPANRRGASPPRPQARRPRQPGQPQPGWAKVMATNRRKTLVVCGDCHDLIHRGTPPHRSRSSHWRAGCPETGHVRFGGRPRGKGPAQAGTSPRGRPYPHRARAVPRRDHRRPGQAAGGTSRTSAS